MTARLALVRACLLFAAVGSPLAHALDPEHVSLADVADVVLSGTDDFGSVGWAVGAADVNADGVSDLLVGAPYSAQAFVALGPLTATPPDSALLRFTSTLSSSELGNSFVGADANGDGAVDLVIGAPGPRPNGAFLFLGPTTAAAIDSDADATMTAYLGAVDRVGWSALIVADHDGDDVADIVLGAPSLDRKRGAVYVVSGAVTGAVDLETDATYKYGIRDGGSRLGTTLADAGDENGDGLEDLVFGVPNEGVAHVLDGGLPAAGRQLVARDAAATFVGPRAFPDQFGTDVASGDVDRDGYGDVLVSATFARNTRGDDAGAVYAFLGPFSGDVAAAEAAVRWEGRDAGGYFGWSVATGGDVDGDGETDTLIGDSYDRGLFVGTVYLALGSPSGVVAARDMPSFRCEENNWLGIDATFVPDWTGDGASEIAIGAPWAPTSAGVTGGEVSVIFSDSLFE